MGDSASPGPTAFSLVGAGNVGTGVAELFRRAGHTITWVWSRSAASAERAAALTGARATRDLDEALEADVVLIGTPGSALPQVVDSFLGRKGVEGTTFVHFSGAVGIGPLRPLEDAGGWAAALHPVAACPHLAAALERIPGAAWGVTVSPGREAWAEEKIRELGGTPFLLGEEDRPLWHAAAAVTSNGMAALWELGRSLLDRIGQRDVGAVLGPLAAGTLANCLEAEGAAAALTGPVVTGDVAAIGAHVAAISKRAPRLLPGYRQAGLAILEVAQASGRLEPSGAHAVAAALSGREDLS